MFGAIPEDPVGHEVHIGSVFACAEREALHVRVFTPAGCQIGQLAFQLAAFFYDFTLVQVGLLGLCRGAFGQPLTVGEEHP